MKSTIRAFFFILRNSIPRRSAAGLLIVLALASLPPLGAAEFGDGTLRLVIDEETGRFSLYPAGGGGALFADEDPRTSFLAVMADDRSYKMGDSSAFKTRLAGGGRNPSLIFESPFMTVTQEFSFLKTPNSPETNGVAVKITLENRGDRQIGAGARFLLDTSLGEGASRISFATDRRTLGSEALIAGSEGDSFWIDANGGLSLAGSLNTGSPEDPDGAHFANWKRLSESVWKTPLQRDRSFNYPPYSMKDAAVCYYYDVRPLNPGEKRSFGFSLALNGEGGFANVRAAAEIAGEGLSAQSLAEEAMRNLDAAAEAGPAAEKSADDLAREQDLAELQELMARIDALLAGGTAGDEDLEAIDSALEKFRAKYGSGSGAELP